MFRSPWQKQIIKSSALLISTAPTEYQGVMTSVCRFLIFAAFRSPWRKQLPIVVQWSKVLWTTKNQGVTHSRRVLLIFTAFRSPREKQIRELAFYSHSSNSLIFGSRVSFSHIRRISLPLVEANQITRVLLAFV